MSNFGTLSNKFPYDFLKFDFSHFTPQDRYFFFVEKRKPKIVGIKNDQKCDRKRNQENSHFYNELLISPKIFGKYN